MAASDSDGEEDFVSYGTPLEPLEEDEPIKKPVPIHDQTVKDEKGRYKRFHGAFTGGFSAGYFNTVGTKEGWTPSVFVSSRQQKADRQAVRPEDFMDEEDLSEHGIAPREILTRDEFSSKRKDEIGDKARTLASLSAPIPGDTLLEELVTPARISVGVELLMKMGWKEGQGVGPRVKRKPQKQKADPSVRIYGCALSTNGSENSEQDEGDDYAPENVTFAPKDLTPIDFTSKDDLHGLGYRGLNPQQALMSGARGGHIDLFNLDSDRATSLLGGGKPSHNRRGGVSGQAFGVGALEEEDDDIYHRDSLSRYDTVIKDEEPGDGLFGWTAPQQYTGKKKGSNKDVAYMGKILEGFTLASKSTSAKTIYPPPNLPRDYRPVHYFRPVLDLSSASPQVAQLLQASAGHMAQDDQQKGRHQLDASQRRNLLGESTMEGPSSVFDLLDSQDKERLAGIRQAAEARKASMVATAAAAAKTSSQQALSNRFVPPATQDAALSAWEGVSTDSSPTFRPFEKNPGKQTRYDNYITKLKQGQKDALDSSLDPQMTEWERGRERDEFIRSAMLYKPTNSTLACRFTRGRHEDDTDTVEVPRDPENDVGDKEAAVKMKMFGKLTRETFEWHPDKLLCKRFNIPDPYPGSGIVGLPKVKRDKFSVFNFLTVTESRQPAARALGGDSSAQSLPTTSKDAPKPPENSRKSRWDVSAPSTVPLDPLSEFLSAARNEASAGAQAESKPNADIQAGPTQSSESSTQMKEEEEDEEEDKRPPMDLFKAIFASSSDEKSSSSSEESEAEEDEQQAGSQDKLPNNSEVATVAQPLPSPISEGEARVKLKPENKASSIEHPPPAGFVVPSHQGLEEEEFGPRLPPALSSGQQLITSLTKEEKHKKKCKEKHKAKKEHKHKKDKKHKKKHKKRKHKSKQKKKKTEEASDSSDNDSDSDLGEESGALSTEDLLRRMKSLRGKK
ncbi:GPTC1 protein, partial [Amia calva]|nr:GPTC1 protein [Amia calva]